jgi:hypothetical protein
VPVNQSAGPLPEDGEPLRFGIIPFAYFRTGSAHGKISDVCDYCSSRKNKFPVGEVMVILFVPLAVLME